MTTSWPWPFSAVSSHHVFVFVFHIMGHICRLIMYLYLCFILSVIFVLSSCIYICVSYYQSYLSSHNLFVFVFHFIGHICPLILYLYFISHHVFVFVFHIIGHICPLITRLLMWKLWAALGQPLSGGYFIPAHHTHRYTNTNTKHTPIQNIHKYKTYTNTKHTWVQTLIQIQIKYKMEIETQISWQMYTAIQILTQHKC